MTPSIIHVLLAEDHVVLREALQFLLEAENDIRVVGQATDGRQAVEMTATLHPDVVVMDIGMPLLNGLEAARKILAFAPETRILILSAHADAAYVEQVMEMGASGYLVKQSSTGLLVKAIRTISKGGTYFQTTAEGGSQPRRPGNTLPGQLASLTPREREVLQLVAEGKANKQTADVLGISIKTVEKHRQSLMTKLRIHDTAGLTRYAIGVGVVENNGPSGMV